MYLFLFLFLFFSSFSFCFLWKREGKALYIFCTIDIVFLVLTSFWYFCVGTSFVVHGSIKVNGSYSIFYVHLFYFFYSVTFYILYSILLYLLYVFLFYIMCDIVYSFLLFYSILHLLLCLLYTILYSIFGACWPTTTAFFLLLQIPARCRWYSSSVSMQFSQPLPTSSCMTTVTLPCRDVLVTTTTGYLPLKRTFISWLLQRPFIIPSYLYLLPAILLYLLYYTYIHSIHYLYWTGYWHFYVYCDHCYHTFTLLPSIWPYPFYVTLFMMPKYYIVYRYY